MSHVLVTGAGGYIGRHVVQALIDEGHEVSAVDLNLFYVDDRAKKIHVDIFNSDKNIYEMVGKPDICIHLAWQDGFIHDSERHMLNLAKHYIFIKQMLEGGLKHISIMGTMHEIGYWEGEIDEDTPANPLTLYGIAKNALRQSMNGLLKNYPDVIYQWLRAYYIYGDDSFNKSIFTKIAIMENEGKKVFPFTSGENKYDFIEVNRLATQIAKASTQKKIQGIINCCSGEPISLKEQVEKFLIEKNYKIRPEYGAFPDREYDSPGVWGNATKIREIMKD